MTSSQHGPYVQGYTRATMGRYRRKQDREVEQIPKTTPSLDWSLQLDSMKPELLVMACQH